jgi:hypothetical protein
MADDLDPRQFGASFKGFLEQMAKDAPAEESFFRKTVREHLGVDPANLLAVSEKHAMSEHPNLQRALEAWLGAPGRSHRLLGVASAEQHAFVGLSLGALITERATGLFGGAAPSEGPVAYEAHDIGEREPLSCVKVGLWLVHQAQAAPVVILLSGIDRGFSPTVVVEVGAGTKERAEQVLRELRKLMQERNVYRGKIIAVETEGHGEIALRFRKMPDVERAAIVLSEGLLARIERQTLTFTRHAEVLKAAGRHLKRGLLLHGPPGTGKTLTAMYLASRMEGRTVFLVTGRGMGVIEHACTLARALVPSTIILEDVDLVAEDRSHGQPSCQPVLFELLNQMDGLAEDADVLFVLTTNRPDILEPALAARPGRIDQAIEVPLPDGDCRRRLFELYGKGLDVEAAVEPFVHRTRGASAAFIRELMRRAALFAADDASASSRLRVRDAHLDAALKELVLHGGVTRQLLGFQSDEGG